MILRTACPVMPDAVGRGRPALRKFLDLCRRKRSSEKPAVEGFALVDVLVSLALLGVISTLMIVFLGQARTMLRVQSATQMQMEADAAARFLETTIAAAEPIPLLQSSPDKVIYFYGDGAQIRFSGVQAVGFGSSALREISVSLQDGVEGTATKSLVIGQKLRRGETAEADLELRTVKLIDGVASLQIEYLDASTGAWSPLWDAKRLLPIAVRFKMSVVRNGATYSSNGLSRLSLANSQTSQAN